MSVFLQSMTRQNSMMNEFTDFFNIMRIPEEIKRNYGSG